MNFFCTFVPSFYGIVKKYLIVNSKLFHIFAALKFKQNIFSIEYIFQTEF
jgi:hypothetical protein